MTGGSDASERESSHAHPIFILGILPRSGTNFLLDLLRAHPDCGPPVPIWEDFLLYHADLLVRYVDRVFSRWNPRWGVDETHRDRLLARLGSGLISFLTEQTESKRIVTKTPRVENLSHFFKLFPDAHLLILVRDGRALIESGIKTFNWHRESAIRKWTEAARTILDFDETNRESALKYRIVRYEDLWGDLEPQLRRILDFLGLDSCVYDFEAATRLPVRGSSAIPEGDDDVHWKPVAKAPDFDPTSRFRRWNRAKHERFNWVAGRYLKRFGYQETRHAGNRLLWSVWNLILDAGWQGVRTLGPIYVRLQHRRRARGRRAKTGSNSSARQTASISD